MYPPLLLLDIDGVVSLFGFDAQRPPPGRFTLVDGIPHFLSTIVSELLESLAGCFELVWCSGWEEKADEVLPAVLGLPRGLRHLRFDAHGRGQPRAGGEGSERGEGAERGEGGRHWKLAAIEAFAGPRRPAAWVDDDFDDSCHAWAARRPGPTRLLQTDPAVGLTAEQTADLLRWAQELGADRG